MELSETSMWFQVAWLVLFPVTMIAMMCWLRLHRQIGLRLEGEPKVHTPEGERNFTFGEFLRGKAHLELRRRWMISGSVSLVTFSILVLLSVKVGY